MTRVRRKRHGRADSALALAIERDDWELVVLLLMEALLRVAHSLPPGTIDDLLALLSDEEESR